jgi:hypothetical protein
MASTSGAVVLTRVMASSAHCQKNIQPVQVIKIIISYKYQLSHHHRDVSKKNITL